MAIALVGTHNVNGGKDSCGVTIDATGANFLLVCYGWYAGVTTDPTGFSDFQGNPYTGGTKRTTATPTSVRIAWSDTTTPTVTASQQITVVGTDTYLGVGYSAWSGVNAGPTVLDGENGKTAASTNVITLDSLTPSEDNCLVVTALMFENNSAGAVSIVTGGWTVLDTLAYNGARNEGLSIGYQIQTTAAAAAPQWNVTNSTNLAAALAIFKGPGGGGGGAGHGPLLAMSRNRLVV
jgi:hypothetical protein